MNYKNCKHYNEVVRVLAENLDLEDINFEIDETQGCECRSNEDSVCELWVTLGFAYDMAPQLGIQHAEQTIANLDSRMKEIATALVSSVGNNRKIKSEPEILPEPEIDNQWYESLTPEQKTLINQISELDNTTTTETNLSQHNLIIEAISEMDIEKLKILVETTFGEDEQYVFLNEIAPEFKNFKEKGDTYLIAHSGSCAGSHCENFTSRGYSFTGNNSKTFYDLIFEAENGICKDICECLSFNVDDIAISDERLQAKQREIDSYEITDSEIDDIPF